MADRVLIYIVWHWRMSDYGAFTWHTKRVYIFRKVYATDVLFSPPYTTPFLYVQICFGVFCTSTVPTLQGPIPHVVQNRHIFRWGNYWRQYNGKMCIPSHSGISVTDRIKINEQNKSTVTGPLYEQAEFEAIWMLLPEDVAVLNHTGYRTS